MLIGLRFSAAFVSTSIFFAVAARGDESAKARFLAEYNPSKEIVDLYTSGFQTTAEMNRRPMSKVASSIVFKSKSNLRAYAYIQSHEKTTKADGTFAEKPAGSVDICNSRYSAQLDTSNNKTLLGRMTPHNPPRATASCILCTGMLDPDTHLRFGDLVQSIGADINTYENVRIRGVEYKMLRVRYQYEYQSIPDAQAWNDFFFDADWLCKIVRCRSGSNMSLGSYQEREITFGTTGASMHLPKKIEIFQVDEQKSIKTLDRTYIMSDHLVATVTEEECTLTSFGLPEPVGVNWDQRPTRHLWWIVLAGGFAFAAVFFGLIARRKRRRATHGDTA